ncbi:hypothetical protein BDP81DRAFT_429148 [Colletotrichum phormii]|uniref:Uncharacterized protein n=1 Tax=Colletotrichum phormii TaxID=359342 RepID=A0AAJ0EGN8_9PEZI|nr:uncharacterized protein BDP81DRAFT_429148 [Colletotrichum phormii]KAK1636160.1 hypothetical protein BDP81DRAFT_429148 [Colletotrichum phormii]
MVNGPRGGDVGLGCDQHVELDCADVFAQATAFEGELIAMGKEMFGRLLRFATAALVCVDQLE